MSMGDLFAAADARECSRVLHANFGHLFPQGQHYEGTVRITLSIDGDIVVLDEALDIEGSPWWFAAVNAFAGRISASMKPGEVREVAVAVDIQPDDDEDTFGFDIRAVESHSLVLPSEH